MKWQWQQWGDQLAREAQQMHEQVERDRQQIREKAQQGRKEQAESHLEQRTADLLCQSHAKAQYNVCMACMFPPAPVWTPMTPRSRPRPPSPPPVDHETLRWEDSVNMNGHRDRFRTVVRRCLRDGLGLSQERAQVSAQVADYWVHKKIIEKTCEAAMKRDWRGAASWGAGIAADPVGAWRTIRYNFEEIKEELQGSIWDKFKSGLKDRLKWKEKYPDLKFLWEE